VALQEQQWAQAFARALAPAMQNACKACGRPLADSLASAPPSPLHRLNLSHCTVTACLSHCMGCYCSWQALDLEYSFSVACRSMLEPLQLVASWHEAPGGVRVITRRGVGGWTAGAGAQARLLQPHSVPRAQTRRRRLGLDSGGRGASSTVEATFRAMCRQQLLPLEGQGARWASGFRPDRKGG